MMAGKKINILLLLVFPLITGMLLGISALPSRLWYVSFVAFVPLLAASERALTCKKPLLVFGLQLLIALIVFYLYVGRWVLQTANLGFLLGLMIVLPFVITVSPFILFRKEGQKVAPVYFISAWLASELFQSHFQLGSPFYNLGHNLGACPRLIQWYEYTGSAGGTLWILASNFALFSVGKELIYNRKRLFRKSVGALGILILPMAVSLLIYHGYKEKGPSSEVLIVHPSTDCRGIKYRLNIYELMDRYLEIMEPQFTGNTEYVVLPETAITNSGWVANLNNNLVFDHFLQRTSDFPGLKLVTGAIIYDAVPEAEKTNNLGKLPGIRYSRKYNAWYYTYNAALQIEKDKPVQMRTKEGLVPYQEYAPYPMLLPRIVPVGVDFQFSVRKVNNTVFTAENRRKTAAMICYELVYGNKFCRMARRGAQAFFVLLNEGWYVESPAVKRQFLQLSVIRAIENRRYIAHASNLGISAFVNQRGEVVARNESKQPGFLKHEIRLNKRCTVASSLGDYLGAIALVSMILMLLKEIITKISHRQFQK